MTLKQTEITKALNDAYLAEELFKKGYKPDDLSREANDFLLSSINNNSLYGVKLAFQYGFKIKDKFNYEAHTSNSEIFDILINQLEEEKVDLKNRKNIFNDNNNLLLQAIKNNLSEEVIIKLSNKGVSWVELNNKGESALSELFKSPEKYSVNLYNLLIENGVDLNAKFNNVSPLENWNLFKEDKKNNLHLKDFVNEVDELINS